MDGQIRLWATPPEALSISAHWDYPDGWRVVITMRRVDQSWQGAYRHAYDHLTTPEMFDVIDGELLELRRNADGAELDDDPF